jgi:hypothetical protein
MSYRPETPIHGAFLERNRKMRFPDCFIFKGLLPLKMVAHPCATLVSALAGRKLTERTHRQMTGKPCQIRQDFIGDLVKYLQAFYGCAIGYARGTQIEFFGLSDDLSRRKKSPSNDTLGANTADLSPPALR